MEVEPESSPRISFSTDPMEDDDDFICITPISPAAAFLEYQTEKSIPQYTDFEFLLDTLTSQNTTTTTTADQLFFDGKLLPFSNQALTHIRLKEDKKSPAAKEEEERENKQNRIGWTCVDEDPSPKPPTCTLLWKELLRIKKQQRSSSSSSLSPSPSSCSSIVGDLPMIEEGKEEGPGSLDKHIKWLKKGLEKTRRSTSTTRIRPMSSNVSTPSISSPPLFPLLLKKVRVLER
ncbi:uncharacterized protein LOC124936592 [Impatiens glandulifera]|uniref:uncharacterized protein LOC124936592 n=1 Tax=Impatiens glandulifera TaxID=253017 RepID=UPI001FB158B6|nr:uncharacterized protein LOC124936592 [Impatiens glandulifera]